MESVLSGDNEHWPELKAKGGMLRQWLNLQPHRNKRVQLPDRAVCWQCDAGLYLLVLYGSKQYLSMCCITYSVGSFDPNNPSCTDTDLYLQIRLEKKPGLASNPS